MNEQRRSRVDREDHELLTFVISWLPYGGVRDDDVFVRFGLTKHRFPVRLRETVGRQRRHIHPQTAKRLMELCEQLEGVSDPTILASTRTNGVEDALNHPKRCRIPRNGTAAPGRAAPPPRADLPGREARLWSTRTPGTSD
ncbi:MAG: hypothetical protein QOI01_6234 [Mycobacterium sp.]|nr:hypothetical protein [Mycobacterium sp.]